MAMTKCSSGSRHGGVWQVQCPVARLSRGTLIALSVTTLAAQILLDRPESFGFHAIGQQVCRCNDRPLNEAFDS